MIWETIRLAAEFSGYFQRRVNLIFAIRRIELKGNYKIAAIESLSPKQHTEAQRMLHACKEYKARGTIFGRNGIALLRRSEVIGVWEFKIQQGQIMLISVSTKIFETHDFFLENQRSIASAMFSVVLELCLISGCNSVYYNVWNKCSDRMMNRFVKKGWISAPIDTCKRGRVHKVLLDEWPYQ